MSTSVQLIEVVKHHYGSEHLTDLMTALTMVFGDEWSKKITYEMLGKEPYLPSIRIRLENWARYERLSPPATYPGTHKIPVIKAVRALTNCGLAEAKRAVEQAEATREWVEVARQEPTGYEQPHNFSALMRDMLDMGFACRMG